MLRGEKTGSLNSLSRLFKIPGEKTPSPLWVFYLFVSLLPFLNRQSHSLFNGISFRK
jgi:hypothetical protein